MASLKEDLISQGMELRETHISRVFLARDVVYKIKRPVSLGFLDFTQLAQRRHFCEQEVELNRRLARDVYLGVVPIVRDERGVHRLEGAGEPVEWAVKMRRLRDQNCAQQLLRQGGLGRAQVVRLAERLAAFHARARCDQETTRYGSVSVIERNVTENFAQTRNSAPRVLSVGEVGAIERWQLGFLTRQRARFEARAASDRIRDGHGDLRLEHCYFDPDGGVQIIDCIEFNERFRFADVCADIAFLSMDLAWHERQDLAEDFLAAYARAADDYDLYGVVDFYESYRAYVRGKVSSMLQEDPDVSSLVQARAAEQARKYYLLSESCAREPLEPPAIYVVAGLIAAGKSTVAQALGDKIHAPVLAADRTRKSLLGASAFTNLGQAAWSGAYTPEMTERVYQELLRRARIVLESRRKVVLDASFRERVRRAQVLELARELELRVLFVECCVERPIAQARLAQREAGPSVSDARAGLYDEFLAGYEPMTELPAALHLRLDTARPLAESMALLEQRTL